MVTSGIIDDTFFIGKFLHCFPFSHAASLSYALLLFSSIKNPNTYLLNSMIRALSITSEPEISLSCYAGMREKGVGPDKHTFPLILKVISKSNIQDPFMFYAEIIKFGLDFDLFVRNALISAVSNSGSMEFARRVFDESSVKDMISWTALIDGYVKNNNPAEALRSFVEMRSSGMKIDEVTIASILRAAGMSGNAYFGKWVHGFYVETGRVSWDVYIGNAIVDMYFKCGLLHDARQAFDEMPYRNVVSWTAIIVAYVQYDKCKEALLLFRDMILDNAVPNHYTLTSVLSASARLGALDQGRWIHQYIERNKVYINSALGTALVDMYAKCGCIEEALLVFETLPVKDVYAWSAIINGLALHGDPARALKLFSSMLNDGIQPNEVTFIGVLTACSHGGFVDDGKRFFELMKHGYHLEPNMNHYGCMVDLLSRAGHLEEAMQLISNMPMKPSPNIWGALFGACMIHKAFEMGEQIGNNLINQQPNHSGRYALLANLYSVSHKWDAAAHVRKLMKEKGVEKTPAYSWIEADGLIHEFKAFDQSHKETSNIYAILDNTVFQLKLAGQFQESQETEFPSYIEES
ncbi:hypothetical protein L6164_001038 [Bauhinia variegata]|nr:hypothetical protein L6164_001038 [Bauhinia variegata]